MRTDAWSVFPVRIRQRFSATVIVRTSGGSLHKLSCKRFLLKQAAKLPEKN